MNDTYGHATGDHLLSEIGERLKSCLRETDTGSRLGGDEFTVILPSTKLEANVIPVVEKINASFSKPAIVDGHEVNVGVSIGISFWQETDDVDSLIKKADHAMYAAKESGKNCYKFYADELTPDS